MDTPSLYVRKVHYEVAGVAFTKDVMPHETYKSVSADLIDEHCNDWTFFLTGES